jgi:hypothetical protein
MKKTILVITGVICLPIVLLGVGLTFEWLVNLVTPHPPRPEITYGEFPFRVEYEINGELVVVEDTIICKFDGFSSLSCDIDTKYREWKASFASGRKTLFKQSADLLVDDANHIYFALGSAAYYMGEWNFNSILLVYQLRGNGKMDVKIPPDELFNTYNIRVISYEFSPPIVNSFK